MTGYVKTNRKIIGGNVFEQKKKKRGFKFNPGLALIGLQTTEPSSVPPRDRRI